MEASVISLGVALVAVVTALVAAAVLARQRPREVRAARLRHPAATPPVMISLTRDGRNAHWRVEVRSTAAPTSLDILSYRAAGSGGPWENEPIVEPIRLQPGGWAVLPSVVVGRAPTYDVVIGWTEHGDDGDRTGSGAFTVHESGPVVAAPAGRRGGWIVAASIIALLLVVAGGIVVSALIDRSDDDVATAPPTSSAPGPFGSSTVAVTATTSAPTSDPSAATTAPATVPTTVPATSTSTTVASGATAATTTTAATSTVTSAPPSTSVATTTTIGVTGPSVIASGRIEDCRFGTDCLVVGFSIDGFDSAPSEYVCEFADGERVTFRFVGDGAETACSARSAAPSITVEVAGVRSNTVTPDDLGPIDPFD